MTPSPSRERMPSSSPSRQRSLHMLSPSRERMHRSRQQPYRIGPLRIFIGDEEPDYNFIVPVFLGIGHALTQIFIGAINMTVMAYSIMYTDPHAVLCTLGYHFFMAQAILCLNNTNAWSVLFTAEQRRFTHLFLHMCGIILSITGFVIIFMAAGLSKKAHSVLGLITMCLEILAFLLGPIALFSGPSMTIVHVAIGIPTFIIASVTVGHGVTQDKFKEWAGNTVPYILVAFVTYITVFIMVMAFIKFIMRIKISAEHIGRPPPS